MIEERKKEAHPEAEPASEPNRRWDGPTKRFIALLGLLLIAIAVYSFRDILIPVAIAILLSFILNPTVDFLEKRLRLPRGIAAALILLILIVGMLGLLAAPVTAVARIQRVVRSLQFDANRIINDLGEFFNQPMVIWEYRLDLSEVYKELSTALRNLVGSATQGTLNFVIGVASGAVGLIAWLIFILIATFYLVRDADSIVEQVEQLAPPGYRDDAARLRQEVTEVWNDFLRGQLLLGLTMAVVTIVVDTAIGLPYAWALGLLAGVLELVPYLGPIIAAIPAILLALIQGSSILPLGPFWFAVLVTGLYIMLQQLENNLLVPRILGRSLNLHPVSVMIAVLAGGRLGGILGVFLAAPALATLRVLGSYILCRLYDRDPFAEMTEKLEKEKEKEGEKKLKRSFFKQAGQAILGLLHKGARQMVGKHARRSDSTGADGS